MPLWLLPAVWVLIWLLVSLYAMGHLHLSHLQIPVLLPVLFAWTLVGNPRLPLFLVAVFGLLNDILLGLPLALTSLFLMLSYLLLRLFNELLTNNKHILLPLLIVTLMLIYQSVVGLVQGASAKIWLDFVLGGALAALLLAPLWTLHDLLFKNLK